MRTTSLLILALAVSASACKKEKEPAAGGGSGSAMVGSATDSGSAGSAAGSAAGSGAGAGSAAAGSGSADASAAAPADPQLQNKTGNCPSTVLGAVTKAELRGKDVVLTITAEDKDAVTAIQRRAETLLKEKQDGVRGAGHDQKGTQGGMVGLCPVFYADGGVATAKNDAKGVTITITPKDQPEALKATIDERIAKSSEWVAKNIKPGDQGNEGGVGGGRGEHGSTRKGDGDGKGKERKGGTGGGQGTGGGGGKGTGGGGGDTKKAN